MIADLCEIWFDDIENPKAEDIKKIFHKREKPIIYKFTGKTEIFEKIIECKPEYIDLDISTTGRIISEIRSISPKTKIIISHHDFKKTPTTEDLRKIAKKMLNKGADIVKIATHAEKFTDSLRMLSFLSDFRKSGQKAIIICMGKQGRITRVAGHLIGNYLMYAPLKAEDKTAPGQIPAKELSKIHSICH